MYSIVGHAGQCYFAVLEPASGCCSNHIVLQPLRPATVNACGRVHATRSNSYAMCAPRHTSACKLADCDHSIPTRVSTSQRSNERVGSFTAFEYDPQFVSSTNLGVRNLAAVSYRHGTVYPERVLACVRYDEQESEHCYQSPNCPVLRASKLR